MAIGMPGSGTRVAGFNGAGDIEGPRWLNGRTERHRGSRPYDRTAVYRHQMGSDTY